MSPKKQKNKHNGISLRNIQVMLMVATILFSGAMFFSTFRLSASFRDLTAASEQQVQQRKAARELMDASDYLTEKVQRFAVTGKELFLEDYMQEALVAKRRHEALAIMRKTGGNATALEDLQAAMAASNELMQREYYAMRLVIEAKGLKDYPDELKKVVLSAADKQLTAEAKQQRAMKMVFDDNYYVQKNRVRQNMQASLDALEKAINTTNEKALSVMKERLVFTRIAVATSAAGVFFLVWLASHLGIHPILNAVERIKHDKMLPEAGTSEFRFLVRAYNRMYDNYKKSIERLNFKASHDELTGVYNRAGYDSLVESIDLSTTYMLLFDLDNFKSINDTYGHETGDAVLVKFVQALRHQFRPDDFICRIGGDEFVVFMQHASEKQEALIAAKIESINKELAVTDDGLPTASISVGIVHGSEDEKVEELFEKTDAAMYRAKQSGKSAYTFYRDKK